MFENILFENDEQKIKIKNTEKMQSSSHEWVFGKTYEKVNNVWEKIRESSVYVNVCVCVMGYTCHEKKVK